MIVVAQRWVHVPSEVVTEPSSFIPTQASTYSAPPSVVPNTKPIEVSEEAQTPVEQPPLVPMSVPRSVSVAEIGYSAQVDYLESQGIGVVPPDNIHVWWPTDLGSAPGANAPDTTYLGCHSLRAIDLGWQVTPEEADVRAPCRLLQRSIATGMEITVQTDAGILTYIVDYTRSAVPEDEFVKDQVVWDYIPGRLVWVTCMYDDQGGSRNDKFIVFATLAR